MTSALAISGRKIGVLRLGAPGDARSGKTPLTAHGVKDATDDLATLKLLLGSATKFNIGVATGSASNVIVIDVDPPGMAGFRSSEV